MTNEEYIRLYAREDVRSLALKGAPEGVDLTWCLQQVEGRQLAARKLPGWAAIEGLHYPPRLSLEQCSSHFTAAYKQQLVARLLSSASVPSSALSHGTASSSFADLTGGFGVDFAALAPLFRRAVYVERLPHLCALARHNFPLLGLPHAEVIEADASSLDWPAAVPVDSVARSPFTLLFLDPARRDGAGRKTVALSDCTPDVTQLLPGLLANSRLLLLKLSPMLDIALALRQLTAALGSGASCPVCEVHAVAVQGECKELLLVLSSPSGWRASVPGDSFAGSSSLSFFAADLGGTPSVLRFTEAELHTALAVAPAPSAFLYEPSPAILKLGAQDALCHRFGVQKLHAMSHIFTSHELVPDFPGRVFRIQSVGDFSKQSLRRQLSGLVQANLTVRNFPQSVADLRRRLRLREGGDTYLFATTLSDGHHALVSCCKVTSSA